MTTVGVLIGIFVPHHIMPTLLSHEATDVWRTIVLFTILAAPVAALVYAVAAYSLIALAASGEPGRATRGRATPAGQQHGHAHLAGHLDGPRPGVVGLGPQRLPADETSHPNTLLVDVTGQQWLWTFSYPGTGVNTRSLVLPINRPVQFNVTSVDVTHGFWPAALGVQVDANPGVVTVIRATPDKLGKFTVRCSQLCGLYHSFMYAPGSVVTTAKFSQWLQSQGASTTTAQADGSHKEAVTT